MEEKVIKKSPKLPNSSKVHPFEENVGKEIYLVMEGGQIVYRNLLDKKVSEVNHGNLENYLYNAERYQILLRHYEAKQMTVEQWHTIYPLNKDTVTSKNFDITTLSILVLYTCNFTGELLQDIQQLRKKRNYLFQHVDEGIPDTKFEHEYENVLQILVDLGHWVSNDVENKLKDLARYVKGMPVTQEILDHYVTSLQTWCFSEMGINKCLSELKSILKVGKINSKHTSKVLERLKSLTEENGKIGMKLEPGLQPALLKKELAKIAFKLRQQKGSDKELVMVKTIMGALTTDCDDNRDLENISKKLPRFHEFHDNFCFNLRNFVQENLANILQVDGSLMAEVFFRIYRGEIRCPQLEVNTMKELHNPNKQKLFLQGMDNLKMTVQKRSLFLQEISARTTWLAVLHDLSAWEDAILRVFRDQGMQRKLTQAGPCCLGSKISEDIVIDINIVWKAYKEQGKCYEEFTASNSTCHFYLDRYFLTGDYSSEMEVKPPPNIIIEILLKKGGEYDLRMEEKLSFALQMDWKNEIMTDGLEVEVTVESAAPKMDFRFSSRDTIKKFNQTSSVKDVVSNIFEKKRIKDLLERTSLDVIVRAEFHMSEYSVKGIVEPGVPSPPRHVKVIDATTHTLTIEWKEPKIDYGLPILAYHVERFDFIKKKWIRTGNTEPPVTTYRIADLEMGHKYKIRVLAVNKLGRSNPCTTDGPVSLLRLPGSRGKSLAVNRKERRIKI
ncbi:uncharacterized protein LOC134251666 [Saccostrea cucullata]|uniref:uncharacterized protein LOC134251666 n=1 Tax=Saccostrea cuccullata TaxID=36930 RepID=UPI002ED301A6